MLKGHNRSQLTGFMQAQLNLPNYFYILTVRSISKGVCTCIGLGFVSTGLAAAVLVRMLIIYSFWLRILGICIKLFDMNKLIANSIMRNIWLSGDSIHAMQGLSSLSTSIYIQLCYGLLLELQ